MLKVSGSYQYRHPYIYVWVAIKQDTAEFSIASGPIKYTKTEWERVRTENSEIAWFRLPNPPIETWEQKEIGN